MKKIKFEQQNKGIKTLYYLKVRFKKHLLKIDLAEFLKFIFKVFIYIALIIHTFTFVRAQTIANYTALDWSLIVYFIISFYVCYNLYIR